jgi:hypothetical protein
MRAANPGKKSKKPGPPPILSLYYAGKELKYKKKTICLIRVSFNTNFPRTEAAGDTHCNNIV